MKQFRLVLQMAQKLYMTFLIRAEIYVYTWIRAEWLSECDDYGCEQNFFNIFSGNLSTSSIIILKKSCIIRLGFFFHQSDVFVMEYSMLRVSRYIFKRYYPEKQLFFYLT